MFAALCKMTGVQAVVVGSRASIISFLDESSFVVLESSISLIGVTIEKTLSIIGIIPVLQARGL